MSRNKGSNSKKAIAVGLMFAFLTAACQTSRPTSENSIAQNQQERFKLASGRELNVTSINKYTFPNGEVGLILSYQTEIPIQNLEELKKEVAEVWEVFRVDVEAANANAGIIRATHIEDDGVFVKNGKGYGFVYKKNTEGKWYLIEK